MPIAFNYGMQFFIDVDNTNFTGGDLNAPHDFVPNDTTQGGYLEYIHQF